MIVQRPKMTMKEVEDLSLEGRVEVLGNYAHIKEFPKFTKWYRKYVAGSHFSIYGFDKVTNLGKPNVIMQKYESRPAVWVFEDTDTGLIWCIYSDGLRKNAYKGTRYEMTIPNLREFNDKVLVKSVTALFRYIDESKL